MKWLLIIVSCILACKSTKRTEELQIIIPNKIVLNTDSALQFNNGIFLYQQQAFSGYIQTNFKNNRLQSIESFYLGKQQYWSYYYFENGKKQSARYYHLGEKDSTHTGWWDNGNKRFVYQFKNGNYHGWFKEFYANGKPLKEILYVNGKDSCGKGWRDNGKIFMNYVMKEDRRYGIINPQLCYTLKTEKIQQ